MPEQKPTPLSQKPEQLSDFRPTPDPDTAANKGLWRGRSKSIRMASPYGYQLLMDFGHRIYNGTEGTVIRWNRDGSAEVQFGLFTATVPAHWMERALQPGRRS